MNANDLSKIAAKLPLSESVRKLNQDHANPDKTDRLASRAVVEPNPSLQSVAENEGKTPDPVRRLVRYTLFRVRPVDQENWCTKHFTDALVTARILFDDSPQWCQIQVEQVQVSFPSQERTEIEVSDWTETIVRP